MSEARERRARPRRVWPPAGIDAVVLPAAGVAIVVALGFGLVVPVLPLYARSFGVTAAQVGLLVSAFALVRLLCDLPAGRLVGLIGSARASAIGTAVVAVSSAAAGLAPTFALLVLFRGLGGVGSALFSTGLMSYLLAAVPRERMGRAMSAFNGAFLLGSAFGPTVGGLAAGALGLRGPFFLYAAFCAAASVVALLLLRAPAGPPSAPGDAQSAAHPHPRPPPAVSADPSAHPPATSSAGSTTPPAATRSGSPPDRLPVDSSADLPPRPAAAGSADLPAQQPAGETPAAAPPLRPSRALAAALSSGFALWWLLGGFRFAFVPLYAQERLGLDTSAIGLGVTASALANLALLYPAGHAADRIGRRAVGVPAFVALAVAAGALLLADGLVGYVLANAVFGAAYAAASVVPGTLLADATPAGRSGIAAGVGSLANDLGNVLGPVAVGAVLDTAGYPAALALAAGPALLAAGAIAASRRPA